MTRTLNPYRCTLYELLICEAFLTAGMATRVRFAATCAALLLISLQLSYCTSAHLTHLRRAVARWLTYWVGPEVVEHWMLTGEFVWKLPVLGTWQRWKDPDGRPPCDWWGINYYSRGVVGALLVPTCHTGEIMTDMPYPMYPEGLYDAVKRWVYGGLWIGVCGAGACVDDQFGDYVDYLTARSHARGDGEA